MNGLIIYRKFRPHGSFTLHGTGNRTGKGNGNGNGEDVHIAAGPGVGVGAENIMPSCLHVLKTALFEPCVNVFIILEKT